MESLPIWMMISLGSAPPSRSETQGGSQAGIPSCWTQRSCHCRAWAPASPLSPTAAWAQYCWWSFFDLLGYSAAHCPVVGSPDGTEQGNEMLFSQEPLGRKYSNYILENMRRKRFPDQNIFLQQSQLHRPSYHQPPPIPDPSQPSTDTEEREHLVKGIKGARTNSPSRLL